MPRHQSPHSITTVQNLRVAFWEKHPDVPRKKYRDGSYPAAVEDAFSAWLKDLESKQVITPELAKRARL